MSAISDPESFQLSKGQLLAFRVILYSIPVAACGVAIYCLVNRVPNPHSIVPKSVIAFMSALSAFLICNRADLYFQFSKDPPSKRRKALIVVTTTFAIFWLVVLMFRNSAKFTGDGDPVFPCIWLYIALFGWFYTRDCDPKAVKQ